MPPPRLSRLQRARQRALDQYRNWRILSARVVLNGVAVVLTALIVPGLEQSWRPGGFVIVGVVFGLLNAFVKPVLQFLLLPAIFATFGIVVIVIDGLLLVLLDAIAGDLVEVDGILPFFLGGLVVGVIGLVLEYLLGLSPPLVDTARERSGGE